MRRVLDRAKEEPRLMTTDGEFEIGPFETLMERRDIEHNIAKARQDLATVDRAIGMLKEAVAEEQEETGTQDWCMAMVNRAADGYNSSGRSALTGEAPRHVEANEDLVFFLKRRNMQHAETNQKVRGTKEERLRAMGGFRIWVRGKQGLKEDRKFAARAGARAWSRDVKPVGEIRGQTVKDANTGAAYPLAEVLPVRIDTEALPEVAEAEVLTDRQRAQRAKVQDIADVARDALEEDPDLRLTNKRLEGIFDRKLGRDFEGINKSNPIKGLADVFPDRFEYVPQKGNYAPFIRARARAAKAKPRRPRFRAGALRRPEEPEGGEV
jgi:hypothetical protein